MNTNKSFIILCVALFGLFVPSFQQEDPEKFMDELCEKTKTIVIGAGVDGVRAAADLSKVEFVELSAREPEEWTFEVITKDGELYNFVDDNGTLTVNGPDGLKVDVSHSYAESAGVKDSDAADAFGEWVIENADFIYEVAGLEQID